MSDASNAKIDSTVVKDKASKVRKSDHEGRHGKKPRTEIPDKWVGGAQTPRATISKDILTKNRRALTSDGKPMFPDEQRKPKKKVACMIGYCGTGYRGMQINPPNKTIEGDIFAAMVQAGAISKNNSNDLKKNGFMRAARTDKGVHAAGNVISLKMIIEDEQILQKINDALPAQIRMWGYQRVNKAFDCRKMCSSRVYEYLMPTYSFLPPRYKSPSWKLVKAEQAANPQMRVDARGEQFWIDLAKQIEDAGVTESQLAQIAEANREDIQLTVPLEIASKKVRQLSHEARKNWRSDPETIELFRSALKLYLGSHNFHNFTNGKTYRDPSASRYMKSITVSEPFVIGETEWISVKIHGQSFMLHQIRKMIGMASICVRTGCSISKIKDAFGPDKINIPKAPALGLLLDHPVYDGYNNQLVAYGHEPIDFDKYSTQMDAFKHEWIYSKIYAEEESEHTFHAFFGFIDFLTGQDSSNGGAQIYEFLTGHTHKEVSEEAGLDRVDLASRAGAEADGVQTTVVRKDDVKEGKEGKEGKVEAKVEAN